jgi:hypothetical protein
MIEQMVLTLAHDDGEVPLLAGLMAMAVVRLAKLPVVEAPDQWAARLKGQMAKAVNFVDEHGRVDTSLPGWPWGTPTEP